MIIDKTLTHLDFEPSKGNMITAKILSILDLKTL